MSKLQGQVWNLPGFSSGYQGLLGEPSVAAAVTIAVPAGKGNAYPLSGGGLMGVVDGNYCEQLVVALLLRRNCQFL
jgi:hypothetical protein